ncbi:MAG: type II 3-dehydroquinate dehydratase [Firmicutes bacterium]|nr:type II 3-dehydroquinate dehydratase [Bacillota bacterium]
MKILVINGPNINMLGVREPKIYGNKTHKDLVRFIREQAKRLGVSAKVLQSNHEGEIVSFIQNALNKFNGIIINAGAYTHTSIAILDALKAVNIKTCEVHLSDIENREDFRKFSFVSLFAEKAFKGFGFDSYKLALEYFAGQTT